ncbi:MAG: septal junction protein FraD [Nostochopsis sp.]
MQLIRDLFGIFGFIGDIYDNIKDLFIPKRAFAWQTLIYLSIFSWLMSSLSTGFVKSAIALCGWALLVAGTAWYTTENPVVISGTNMPIGAILTGFLVSAFAFRESEQEITIRTIVLWPTISALITAIPEFFEGTGTEVSAQVPKIEDRQKIIILVAVCMVISCWLQFGFVVNKWLEEFPSLQTDNIKRTFVQRTEPQLSKTPRNGGLILNKLEPIVKEQIANRPWSEIEQWLKSGNERVNSLGREVIETSLREIDEKSLWRTEARISSLDQKNPDIYKLDLLSVWSGPTSTGREYYLRKTCRVEPINVSSRSDQVLRVAEIACGRSSNRIIGSPPEM